MTAKNNSGQIVVEYILLLIVGVMIASLITTVFVSRNAENPGILTTKWRQIIEVIAKDKID
ncbi:MAG: hypothetical protein HOO06_04295 [Bdellovibrionaceae bacterium]|jgi:uncharacterized protein (UPF0333 family)|nr:hypothetical protein [Pseudobdellovibrionaceae bacterium]